MGKDWYWGGRSSKRSGGQVVVVDRDTISSRTTSTTTTTSAGCMCAVFQLFDFHQFQFATNLQHQHQHDEPQPSFKPTTTITAATPTTSTTFVLPEKPNIPKGAEAPRNSLKSEEGTSLSSIIEDEEVPESLNHIHVEINQIKTSSSSRSNDFVSDTSSNSPGTKTPGLVARLMGLDLLPDQTNSPTHHFTSPTTKCVHTASTSHKLVSRSHTQPLQNKARHLMVDISNNSSPGTRSLPETPRISSARRSDVDHHHRLSLQINKENVGHSTEDLDFSRLSSLRRKQLKADHHNQDYDNSTKSPGYYARQIVKQVKDGVTRKVGLDITNTVLTKSRSAELYHGRRDYDLVNNQAQSAKRSSHSSGSKGSPKFEDQATSRSSSSAISSCSPRLRFTESKTSTTTTTTTPNTSVKDHQSSFQVPRPTLMSSSLSSFSSPGVKAPAAKAKPVQQQIKGRGNNKATSGGGNGGGRRVIMEKIMQEETFVFGPTSHTTATNCRRVGSNIIPDKTKSKKTPLSNDLLNLNVVPITRLALKKTTKDVHHYDHLNTPQKQPGPAGVAEVPDDSQELKRIKTMSQLSCSQTHNNKYHHHVLGSRDKSTAADDAVQNTTTATTAAAAAPTTTATAGSEQGTLRRYITRILGRTGLSATSHVSFTNWFSPSHPLDPSIFHRLEIYYSTYFIPGPNNTNPNSHGQSLGLRFNRKLVFDVVDEMLVEILRPYINLKPWIISGTYYRNVRSKFNSVNACNIGMQGLDLIETLCSRVEGFPCKDCQVLEDIDALIDKDLSDHHHQSIKTQKEMAFEEEGESLVTEIEKDIVDTLVHETALILVGNKN